MKCLIIAAGLGSRLSDRGNSKPLIQLLGVPLIERVIGTFVSAGITEFFVVLGYRKEAVIQFLGDLKGRFGISITIIENPDWKRQNGISVLRAKEFISGAFFLTMTDHIFDQVIPERLARVSLAVGEVILAVDMRTRGNPLIDLDDVTRVLVSDGKILDIGKKIENYNAFDTGIFSCSTAIFSAIEESSREGDESLSGGIKKLAKNGKARSFDIGSEYWIDVDDDRAFLKARKKLLALERQTEGAYGYRQKSF